jgi:NAD(P)-dependent dehydrogenase (short-subunit alcohol dehydrogenase family)
VVKTIYKDKLFAGKVALVTGGGTGIGLRTARELAQLGATVVLASRRGEVVEAAAASIAAAGGKAHAVPLNVREAASVEAAVEQTLKLAGGLDYLINNAGGQFLSPAAAITRKGWDAVIETNLTGTFAMSQAAFAKVFKAKGGAIVNVIANVRSGFPNMAHTGAARAGVGNLTMTLALEWGRYGVRVNAVAPGVIDTGGLESYGPEMAQQVRAHGRFNVTGRLGTEAEVANAILFLLTPAAQYLTGVTLAVDGGESIYHPLAPPAKAGALPPLE